MDTNFNTQSKRSPEELLLDFMDAIWKPPYNLDKIDGFVTEDYTLYSSGNIIEGRDSYIEWAKEFHKKLIGATTDTRDIIYNESENKVVSRWVCHGKNNGIFDLSPDGKPISFTGIAIWEIKDNLLSKCWVERGNYKFNPS